MSAPVVDPATLQAAYTAQNQATRAALATYLGRMWAGLTSWRDPDAARFAPQAAAVVTGAQQRTAALTAAYLGQAITTATGTAPTAPPAVTGQAIRGVPATEVYARPFKTVWWALSQGKDLPTAVDEGAQRLQDLAATDVQLAKTHASRQVLAGSGRVTGYRRVLEGAHSCAMCVIASTQRYNKENLLPIHPGCDCGVEPLFGGADVVDPVTLEQLHDAVERDLGPRYVDRGARGPLDYRNILVTHQHGEIGPILGIRGDAFTGPADLR